MKNLKIIIVSLLISAYIETAAQVDSVCQAASDSGNLIQTAIKGMKRLSSNIQHKVSYYADKFNGRLTASGKIFRNYGYTCAAISLYNFGDILYVTNIENGKSVKVVVTDRGNFQRLGRTLDLSKRAFSEIADPKKGLCYVTIEKLNTNIQ